MENKKKSLIPKAALIKAWFIWETFPQTCYNYERMMGQVVAHMFSAIINFLYKDNPAKRKEVMKREIEFFNVHIEFGACILGMAVALEEQKAMGEEIPDEFITNLKTSLMGPLAGMGDTIWQGVVIPILLAVCIDLTRSGSGNIWGAIISRLSSLQRHMASATGTLCSDIKPEVKRSWTSLKREFLIS